MSEWLITPERLHARLAEPDLVVIDTRFDLLDPDAGRRDHDRAQIPGAHYAHLDEDLAGPATPGSGRHPLPDPQRLVQRLARWGVSGHSQVVVYDDSGGAIAARLWWLLRWLGHPRVALLDGGFRAWRAADFPTESGAVPAVSAQPFEFSLRPELAVSTGDVLRGLEADDIVLIDARDRQRFEGLIEPIDARAGHIPGARNHPYVENLDERGRFLDAATLRERYRKTLGTCHARDACCMCGSGVTACHDLLAMEIAGLEGARLYVGSWSEWISDATRSVS